MMPNCKEINNKCFANDNTNYLHKLITINKVGTNSITACLYKCFLLIFKSWAKKIYYKENTAEIEIIAETAFADGVLKMNEKISTNQLIESNATIKTTLFSFCKFKLLEHLQKENRYQKKIATLQYLFQDHDNINKSNDDNFEMLLLKLNDACKQMTRDEIKLIKWRHIDLKTNEEMAKLLNMSVPALTNKLYRAMTKLKKLSNF
jgi:hypothetical protein